MLLTFHEPLGGGDRSVRIRNPQGKTLAAILGPHAASVNGCLVNGFPCEAWHGLIPTDEHVDLYLAVGEPISGSIVSAVIVAAVSTALSIGVSFLMRALADDPGDNTGSPEDVFGIAGLTNTTALGTPKFLVYGERRVFGHLIATKTSIGSDGTTTNYAALYFMGEGPIESMSQVQVNDADIALFSGTSWDWRPGTDDQDVIPGFELATNVWGDGRELPHNGDSSGTNHLIYTTRGADITRATLIFSIPFLFNLEESTGKHNTAWIDIKVEYREAGSGGGFTTAGQFQWQDNRDTLSFRTFDLPFPSADQWEIRLLCFDHAGGGQNNEDQDPSLYNVQEFSGSDTSNYPHSSLLAVFGVASAQITSFESMRASALVKGRKVVVWTGVTEVHAWTNKRTWIVRDMLTDSRVGLGHKLNAALIDKTAMLEAQTYYDETVDGEARDQCDVIINDRRPGWDWIRQLLAEGRAVIVPSGGLLKYIVDRDRTPNLLWSMPGNIMEGSLKTFWGGNGTPPNTILGEFPDQDKNEVLSTISVEASDIGSEPTIPATVSLSSIKRETQCQRELFYQLKKRRKVQRRFSWRSPQAALVSEPFDVDTLSYQTTNYRRGYSGYCPAGCTTTNILLDRLVTLAAATTYVLIIRHLADNATERTIVATAAGTWGAVAPTVALTTAPAEGDLWSIGKQNTHQVDVLIESVQRNDDGTTSVEASQYIPGVYDPEDPPLTSAVPAAVGQFPIPLRTVSVSEEVTTDGAGTLTSYYKVQVTPGIPTSAGTAQGGGSNYIDLATSEPAIDDYFNSLSTIRIIAGTGSGQRKAIVDYTGSTRRAIVASHWSTPPDATSEYVATFGSWDEFQGFDVEAYFVTGDAGQPAQYSVIASTQGTTLYLPSRTQPEVMGWRIVPFGRKGGRNRQGAWNGASPAVSDPVAIAAASSAASEDEVNNNENRRLLEQILLTLQQQTALLQQVVKRNEEG